jgi:flagellar biogenesis protein FliO
MRGQPDRRKLTWIIVGGIALLVAILFIAAMAPAGSSTGTTPSPVLRPDVVTADGSVAQSAPSSGGSSGFHLGFGGAVSLAWRLGLVAIILGVAVAGLRWWGKRTSGPKSVTGFLRVVDTLAISNGRTVHLLALGDRVIAIGATAQQLTLLDELEPDEAQRVLAAIPAEGEQHLATFAAELFQSMRGGPARKRSVRHEAVIDKIAASR